jgi:beta-lactamase regulating signal transducer with metallopeptidase domain
MTFTSSSVIATPLILIAKSSLLLCVGYGAARLLHRAPAAVRHIAWLTAIVGVLLVPLFNRYTPVPVRVLPASATMIASPALPPSADPSTVDASREMPLPLTSVASTKTRVVAQRRWSGLQIAFAIWAIGALMFLARFALGVLAVRRLTQRSRRIESGAWIAALEQATTQLGLRSMPRLVMSDEVDMAFTFDALTPTIVLPTSAEEWLPDRSRSVLLHELAHIRRRDLVGHALAGFACAINWFNPVVWLAARQLRVESELASDEVVLRAGVRPSAYAQHLLDMVTSVSRRAPHVALAMARPKEFEGRLVAILDPIRRRSNFGARQVGGVTALLGMSAISIGAIVPTPREHAPIVVIPVAIAQPFHKSVDVGDTRATGGRGGAAIAVGISAAKTDAPTKVILSSPASIASDASQARLSTAAVALLLRYGTSGVMNPMIMLLRQADSLHLSGAQADSIATLNRRYMIALTGIWAPIAAGYAEHSENLNIGTEKADAIATRETTRALIGILHALDAVLTPDQRDRVSDPVKPYLDAPTVEAIAATSPTGVFVAERQLFGMTGRGRSGG